MEEEKTGTLEEEQVGTENGFSRRTFVKGAAVAGGSAALYAGGISLASPGTVVKGLTERGATPAGELLSEQVFTAVCSPNCWGGCHIEAHVRDGRLVKTAMAPFPEARYNRICLRGLSHAQWVYNPDRLKYPMKRVGKRGEGKFERISWKEALDTIEKRMKDIRAKHGSRAFAFAPGSGNYGAVNGMSGYALNVFMNLFQATNLQLAVDQAVTLGTTQVTGTGFGGNEPLDMANAKLLIAWGTNMTESQVHNWHFVADMKENGGKLVVIDPNYSILASKADTWIPLNPGSDPALGLSLLNVLVEEKLYDRAFVVEHTTLPFLVRADNGTFLRAADGETMMVWDTAVGKPVPAGEARKPALEGSFTADKVAVKPAFQLLKERLVDWTPEKAKDYTDVPPETVRWLAREYAKTKQSTFYPSMGIDRWENSHLNGRIIATLAALTGNIGVSGAAIGSMGGAALMILMYGAYAVFAPTNTFAAPLNGWLSYDAIETGKTKMLVPLDGKDPSKGVTKDPVEVPWPIKAIWFTHINISNMQDNDRFVRLLQDESKLEFVVCSDSLPTDTVQYADIVLPATHWLENDDVVGGLHPYMFRHHRAIEPAWEARSEFRVFKELASRFGWGKHYPASEKETADKVVETIAGPLGAGAKPILDAYKKTGAVRFSTSPYVDNADLKFRTPTGRMEPYSERVVVNYPPTGWIPTSAGEDPLPYWEPPQEAWKDNPLRKKYPLTLMSEHSRWRVHTSFWNQPWLREVNPEPYVELSTQDATARGIEQGDYVEIFNDRGKTVARARVSGRMRPGMANLPKGWQRSQTKDGSSYSSPTKNWANRLSANGSFFDTLVEIRKVKV